MQAEVPWRLNLGNNNLSGTIPSCILKYSALDAFDVYMNSIEGTVSLISFISELNPRWFRLSLNYITVEIDDPYHPLPFDSRLQYLSLMSCNMKGYIPTLICNLTHLVLLKLDDNQLTGAIPSCLFNLQNLSLLSLSGNNLQGTLPHSLYLHEISWVVPSLVLAHNNLGGPLPLPPPNVIKFDLSNNKFTGEISMKIVKRLSNARYVSLSGNKLSGSIPSSICLNEHDVLMHLDLSNNQLSGKIPSDLQHCNSLISLNLGKNNLTGNVPRVKNLKSLQLNDNILSGTFPLSIQQLQDLEVLNLMNNNFQGSIPTFIGALHNLQVLLLRSNKFNGSIPKEITHLRKLQIVDLSKNKLSGPITDKIGDYLEMLTSRPNDTSLLGNEISYTYSVIDLSCNVLEGNIPEQMGLLKGLALLNLSHNRFSGEIPTNVGNMSGLGSLDLSFNKLSGNIPQSLTLIDSLGYLNLSYNNLNGSIPRGYHFDTLSVDGSAYIGNPLLCGFPAEKSCESDPTSTTDTSLPENEDDEDEREKWLFYGVVVLGYGVGFWGLFLVLLLRKQKWWFGYWRAVDIVTRRIAKCVEKWLMIRRNGVKKDNDVLV